MNKKMKKIIATIVLTGGIFSQFPVAFCSGSSEEIDLLIESILKSDDKESKETLDVSDSKMPAKTLAEKREDRYNCERSDEKIVSKRPDSDARVREDGFLYLSEAREKYSYCRSVNIPYGIKRISTAAFKYFNFLEDITLPDGLESIGRYAFDNCRRLRTISLPNSLYTIQDFAFRCCKSLEYIYIPKSVKHLGSGAFDGCDRLRCIKYGDTKYYSYRNFCEDFYRQNG